MDVFHILNNHRGTPVPEKPVTTEETIADWAPTTMVKGIGQIKTWLGYAVRCLVLDRSAYKEVAADPYMTGTALLIALLAAFLGSLVRAGGFELTQFIASAAVWLFAMYILFLAGYSLTKKGTFTKTFRAVGFAQIVYVLAPIAYIPSMGNVMRVLILLLGFVSTWIGAARRMRHADGAPCCFP